MRDEVDLVATLNISKTQVLHFRQTDRSDLRIASTTCVATSEAIGVGGGGFSENLRISDGQRLQINERHRVWHSSQSMDHPSSHSVRTNHPLDLLRLVKEVCRGEFAVFRDRC